MRGTKRQKFTAYINIGTGLIVDYLNLLSLTDIVLYVQGTSKQLGVNSIISSFS